MLYSPRLCKILQICLSQDDYISMEQLSSQLQISKRTIFRELSNIEDMLIPYKLSMSSRVGKGIKIEGNVEDKEKLKQLLTSKGIHYINKEDRHDLLIFEVLRTKEVHKLYYYANLFQVSEATISNDFDVIENWFELFNLELSRRQGHGIELLGEEADYRKALTSILGKSIQESAKHNINFYDSNSVLTQIFMNDDNGIMKLLDQTILTRILEVFETYRHELDLDRYAQSSYIGLIIHLSIAIDRICKHEEIKQDEFIIDLMKEDVSFEKARQIAKYLEDEFEITIPEIENAFIAMHIKGAKLSNATDNDWNIEIENTQYNELELLIDEMISSLETNYQDALMVDYELRQGLLAHLKPTLIRMKHQLPIYNPLLSQIKELYSSIYHDAYLASKCITKHFHYEVNEDEIGYIAMHFGAAIERAKKQQINNRKIHIGIVCSSGIGVSSLLLARIRKVVDDNVSLQTLSVNEVELDHCCELLISTFDFNQSMEKIIVNPLLSQDDVEVLKKAIATQRTKAIKKHHVVESNASQYQTVTTSIKDILENFEIILCEDDCLLDQLLQYIASNLHSDKVIQENIFQVLKQRETTNSTIFKEFGFALFHAQCEDIATCTFKLCRPKETFEKDALKGIQFAIVMFLPIPNIRLQKDMMSILSRKILEDETYFSVLQQGNKKEVYDYIDSILKNFLFEIIESGR